MGIRYVGGKPARVMSNTIRKNTDRWMYQAANKRTMPSFEDALCVLTGVASIVITVAFILVCFR
jgi:hypothetical protein